MPEQNAMTPEPVRSVSWQVTAYEDRNGNVWEPDHIRVDTLFLRGARTVHQPRKHVEADHGPLTPVEVDNPAGLYQAWWAAQKRSAELQDRVIKYRKRFTELRSIVRQEDST